jgi:hypothetical protein
MPCMAGISIIYLLRAGYEGIRTPPSDFRNPIPLRTPFKKHTKFPNSQKDKHSGGKPRSEGVSFSILRKTSRIGKEHTRTNSPPCKADTPVRRV